MADVSRGGNNRLGEKSKNDWLRDAWSKGAGKGDRRRPTDKAKYDEEYERIFGKREIKTWKPEDDPRKGSDDRGTEGDERESGASSTDAGTSVGGDGQAPQGGESPDVGGGGQRGEHAQDSQPGVPGVVLPLADDRRDD